MEQILSVQSKLKLFPAPRIPIETTFVRICRPVDDLSVAAPEARVALLETRPAPAPAELSAPVEPPAPKAEEPLPPWDDAPAEPEPAVAPAPEPVREAPVQTKPVEPPAAKAGGEAEAIWAMVKQKIMEMNPMVYFYVKETRGTALNGDVRTVEFPAAQESNLNGMRAPRNLKIAKDAIDAIRPGTELTFRLEALMDENEEKLKELFGSSLTIQ